MTIAEIESTLRTLFARHPDLNEEMLTTLLAAGGWELVHIQEAVSIFKSLKIKIKPEIPDKKDITGVSNDVQKNDESVATHIDFEKNEKITQKENNFSTVASDGLNMHEKNVENKETVNNLLVKGLENSKPSIQEIISPPPVVSEIKKTENIVYFDSSGQEEGDLSDVPNTNGEPVFIEEKLKIKEGVVDISKQDISVNLETNKDIKNEEGEIVLKPEKEINLEPQSLIEHKEEVKIIAKEVEPPMNLPLKPFESSPHVWPFSKYKDVFHGETMPVVKDQDVNFVAGPSIQKEVQSKNNIRISGFDREDESLIVMTGVALLIIILLLTYMYSNGRL